MLCVCSKSYVFEIALKIKQVNITSQERSPKMLIKEHLLIWNLVFINSRNIYLYNYQTETAIFIATTHEKTIMADV